MTYEQIKADAAIRTYIAQADASLIALGYTEHSFGHVTQVAEMAGYILETLGYPPRTVELAKIAGFLHDSRYPRGDGGQAFAHEGLLGSSQDGCGDPEAGFRRCFALRRGGGDGGNPGVA